MKKMNTFYIQTESLSHIGVLRRSGRYPWGSGKRPFQSGGGPTTSKKKQIKAVDKKAEAVQKARETRERNRAHEAEKQRAVKEGTAADVLKFKSELSNQELQNALTRIELTSRLERLSQSEMKATMSKIDEIMKGVQTTTNWVKIGTDTYNTLAKLYNATDEGKKKPLTLVGGGGEQKKDKNKG